MFFDDFEGGFEEFGGGGRRKIDSVWWVDFVCERVLKRRIVKCVTLDILGIKTGFKIVNPVDFAGFFTKSSDFGSVLTGSVNHIFTGGVDNFAVTAVIGDEVDFMSVLGEKVSKIKEIGAIGAGKTVNRLPVVTDGKEMSFRAEFAKLIDEI